MLPDDQSRVDRQTGPVLLQTFRPRGRDERCHWHLWKGLANQQSEPDGSFPSGSSVR